MFQDRLNPDPRHTPDNVVPFERVERRPAQKWWERAQAGVLYGADENGIGYIKDMSGAGPDAA